MDSHTLKNKKSVLSIIIIYLFCLSIIAILWFQDSKNNIAVLLSFSFTGIFSMIMIVRCLILKPYSMQLMHWLYIFFFMFVAAFFQYQENGFRYKAVIEHSAVLRTNLLIILWQLSFAMGGCLKGRVEKERSPYNLSFNTQELTNKKLIFLTCLAACIFAGMLYFVGIEGMLSRGAFAMAFAEKSQTLQLIVNVASRSLLTYIFSVILVTFLKNKNMFSLSLLIINAFFFLLICFPGGMARFQLGAIYLGILLFTFKIMRKEQLFIFMFLFGFILIFPLFSLFRLEDTSMITLKSFVEEFKRGYVSPDYDGYSMLYYAGRYVNDYGISYGKQLLGVLLFFVPRGLWSSKPIGSGDFVINIYQEEYVNVSMPIIGEAFINFGLLGVILGGLFLGCFLSRIDESYWLEQRAGLKNKLSLLKLTYPFLILLFFFMCRGDLMSTWAFTCGYILTGVMMIKICGFRGLRHGRFYS